MFWRKKKKPKRSPLFYNLWISLAKSIQNNPKRIWSKRQIIDKMVHLELEQMERGEN